MSYESAWLNADIPCSVAGLKGVESILLKVDHAAAGKEERIIETAVHETARAVKELFGTAAEEKRITATDEITSGRNASDGRIDILLELVGEPALDTDGAYRISYNSAASRAEVKAGTARGLLYGSFRLTFLFKMVSSLNELSEESVPASPLRMLNHWDNMDGSIERGYSGKSFFFRDDSIIIDDRTEAYVRMIASVGINSCVINNVNVRTAATRLITADYRSDLKKLAGIFEKYGVDLYLSLNFAAPIEIGGLNTCDPLDGQVRSWWKEVLDDLFSDVPQLKGFLIKADSEGRPGPFTYGRDHAQGANMLADIIAPYGGIIIWRCFVYNCKQDWRDTKTDRARAQYDNFKPLDGKFSDNVILQIKNGPMDFQPREPVSPLFGGLKDTHQMIEFQIAQEYTGQQKHVCFLIPEFKEILGFKTYIRDKEGRPIKDDTVCDIVTGRTFKNKNCGMAAVTNTGDDANWTGHDLAAANLYGFGRLCFNPALTAEDIEKEWITLTFGDDKEVFLTVSYILSTSWPTYEKYSSPLGVGWMVNPGNHYGPNVDGYEFSEWGTYHRSDSRGMGVERGKDGTGYIGQYNEPNSSLYEKLETCPDELLLFMHHVPYTYRLHSGKTVIQYIYDSHYEGAEEAHRMRDSWIGLKGRIKENVYERVLERLNIQADSADEWRDTICSYYREKSGIPDEKGRI